MATSNISRGLSLVTGVDNGGSSVQIGGGRSSETLYMIDGMQIRGSQAIQNIPTDLLIDNRVSTASKKGFNLFKAAQAKSLRTKFSNLGFWVPNLITNKEGKAYATVTFPDDVTRWKTYVLGMGRGFLNGVRSSTIKSYKPIMVNSIVPRYLYAEDKLEAKAKFINLDSTAHNIELRIVVNDQEKIKKNINLKRNYVDSVLLSAGNKDSIHWQASLDIDTYYKDGEAISIPVFKNGLETTENKLTKLEGDTSRVIDLGQNAKTTIYFNNNVLENILIEVDKLKNYPYSCNEQKASKIKGLLVEEKIRKQLKQKFEHRAMLKKLINRLERTQKPNGSWAWWSRGSDNHRMTLYITEVLQSANKNGYNNAASLLAKEYIQNRISNFNTNDKMYALYLLKQMNASVDYNDIMKDISYYDLNLCSKLYFISNELNYKNKLSKARVYDCLSQISASSKRSYSDNFFYDPSANMALAIKLLKGTQMENHVLKSIGPLIRSGKFIANSNTFSKVYLIEAWLESMRKSNTDITASLNINDSIEVTTFPYKFTTTAPSVKIKHTGADVFTAIVHNVYQKNPTKLDSLFDIKTKFITGKNRVVEKMTKGKDITLELDIMSFRSARNVMIEVPIPAACSYNGKELPNGNISHIEYYKNKAIYYIENLNVGTRKIKIPLRVNFSGDFTLPAARASLMYYPFKSGNNTKKRIQVE
jgi:uncharacterized protein YfaS (alpha-2-macroglobulin family)